MPKWSHSIRAWIALTLTISLCVAVFIPGDWVNENELGVLNELTKIAIIFYFLKQRTNGQNGGGLAK